jgi:hypothetical protein
VATAVNVVGVINIAKPTVAVAVRPGALAVAVTVYKVAAFTLVGVPLMAQVALLILKPAGSQLMPPLYKQAIATLVNFRYTVQQPLLLIRLLPVLL